MKKNLKKILVLATCLIFFLTTAQSVISVELESKIKDEDTIEKDLYSETVTLYRYGLNGEIEQVQVRLDLVKNEDISQAIQEKCKELFENDEEFQSYIRNSINDSENDTNISLGLGKFRVASRGKGFHIQSKMLEKIVFRLLLRRLLLPPNLIRLRTKTIACFYRSNLSTTFIKPIVNIYGNNTNNTLITGPHTLLMTGFKGYTGWFKRVKFTPFIGRSLFGVCSMYATYE